MMIFNTEGQRRQTSVCRLGKRFQPLHTPLFEGTWRASSIHTHSELPPHYSFGVVSYCHTFDMREKRFAEGDACPILHVIHLNPVACSLMSGGRLFLRVLSRLETKWNRNVCHRIFRFQLINN
jgi:hypothetical protein